MAYNNNIPQPGDRISDSQADILENFAQIKTLIDINHDTFGSATQGKHKWVSMPEQGADPATAANEMALYTKQSALTGDTQMFLRYENNGGVVEFTNGLGAAEGWSYLPSGLLMKWGTSGGAFSGLHAHIFPVGAAIPAFNNVFMVLVSISTADVGDYDAAVRVVDWTNLQFRVYLSYRTQAGANNGGYTYLALGN